LYVIAPFFKLFTAYIFTTSILTTVIIVIIQQFATGFFEEAVHRGLMMNGLIVHNTKTVKQRIFTVVIAGAFFGLSHAPNIIFGENPLLQVPSAFLWGMFMAAIYMLSDNLLLPCCSTHLAIQLSGSLTDCLVMRAKLRSARLLITPEVL
jgi:membrane protease YdiL (CAAX protease family)